MVFAYVTDLFYGYLPRYCYILTPFLASICMGLAKREIYQKSRYNKILIESMQWFVFI